MIIAHFLNTLPLVAPHLNAARYSSPLYLYSRSSPLSDGHLDVPGVSGMLALALLVFAAALAGAARRDLFDVVNLPGWSPKLRVRRPAESGPSRAFGMKNGFTRGIGDNLGSVVAWAVGLAVFSALLTALTPNIRSALLEQATSAVAKQLIQAGLTSEKAILSLMLFSVLLPLIAVFAVTIAAAWSGDELNQRLELELVAPVPRWQMFLQRWLAAAVSVGLAAAATAAAIALAIEFGQLDVPLTAVGNAAWTLVLLGACVCAVGFAVASWRPGLVAAVAGAFVAVSYFANLLIPLFGWPDRTRYISVFALYGSPMEDGVGFIRIGTMAAATALLVLVGAAAFQRRDIAK